MIERLPAWQGTEALGPTQTLLLEASAGTGKTWQIAHLVARLVAEEDVQIGRILVMTFTNAAAAELKSRIRERLVLARDALVDDARAHPDPFVAVWQGSERRGELRARLAAAVSGFDEAQISTIHSFSQRTLAQLAFESGQEPGLELLGDTASVVDQWVADELARLYVACDEETLALARDMGWTAARLRTLAKAVTGAVSPELVPAGLPDVATAADAAWLWQAEVTEARAWLGDADAPCASFAAYLYAVTTKDPRLSIARSNVAATTKNFASLSDWLARGGPRKERTPKGPAWSTAFVQDTWDTLCKGGDPQSDHPAWPLFARVTALFARQDALWSAAWAPAALRARAHVLGELARKSALSYDSMLSRLAERMAEEGPEGGLAAAIRGRYDAALVDEFQDTDEAQWTVLRGAFQGYKRLLLIGDPKQAIYAFRGADVHVYMRAAATAAPDPDHPDRLRATMARNWRSSPGYVAAMNHLWQAESGAFAWRPQPGAASFDYVEVAAAHGAGSLALERGNAADPASAPLAIRWLDARVEGLAPGPIGQKDPGMQAVANDCAAYVVRLLQTARLRVDPAPARALQPGDMAVLVRTHGQGQLIQQRLREAGVMSVSAARGSIFHSEVVLWVLALLDALASPGRDGPARTLVTTPLVGRSLRWLDEALTNLGHTGGPTPWLDWLERLQGWRNLWPGRGFMRVWDAVMDTEAVLQRILQARGGERLATDLRQLAELCHAEERRTRAGPAGLAAWLRTQIVQADEAADEQAQRLESDADAVQIVTMHASKGLEYPVVLLPFAWEEGGNERWPTPVHDPHGAPQLHCAAPGTREAQAAQSHYALEVVQERRRLLYVALTRAKVHCVAWLGPIGEAGTAADASAFSTIVLRERGPDGRVLLNAGLPANLPKPRTAAAKDDPEATVRALAEWHGRLDALAAGSSGTITWECCTPLSAATRFTPVLEGLPALEARMWPQDRTLDRHWLITSYSGLASSLPEVERDDGQGEMADWEPTLAEPEDVASSPGDVRDRTPAPSLTDSRQTVPSAYPQRVALALLAGGTEVGKWVHSVLESLDFQTLTTRQNADMSFHVAAQARKFGVPDDACDLLCDALPAILRTPLDGPALPLRAGVALADVSLQDRLDEWNFDLAIAGGADWQPGDARVDPSSVQGALALRLAEAAWDGQRWLAAVVNETVVPPIAGMLTGSIDLVLRVGGRWYIADYKTNRLCNPDNREDCVQGHYARSWLAAEMEHHHYHLQALLYTLALHRHLRLRLKNYDYERDFGGHLYLFLRGMEGPTTPRVGGHALGVYADRWPLAVLNSLDRALAGGRASGGGE